MTKSTGLKPGERKRRFEVYLKEDDAGLEFLSFARLTELTPVPEGPVPRRQLVALACRIYDTRRDRARYFSSSLLGEPVWDMLLALFCLPSRDKKLSVSGLCYASGCPATTGLRWLKTMEHKGLIERQDDARDGRRVWLTLTVKGDQLLVDYLTNIYHKLVS